MICQLYSRLYSLLECPLEIDSTLRFATKYGSEERSGATGCSSTSNRGAVLLTPAAGLAGARAATCAAQLLSRPQAVQASAEPSPQRLQSWLLGRLYS